ncbi:hypothetical protein AKJ09_02509 [Labilithrix luteola]|uniref:Uncharacterized protein n=1 Tax=Labilithrix luteola TaxID=1391654 RepID=A0A0K1PQM9_9BACT|nr:hypothetical protein AKJ09_02509 [Labilithrix luteola]
MLGESKVHGTKQGMHGRQLHDPSVTVGAHANGPFADHVAESASRPRLGRHAHIIDSKRDRHSSKATM